MDWKTLLAYISGSVDEELLLRKEYLVAENRILRDQIKGRVPLSDAQRQTLTEIGQKLGKKALAEVAHIVKPDTILGWNRKLRAEKFDGSNQRKVLGRRRVDKDLEDLVVRMARRIPVGAMIGLPGPWSIWATPSAIRPWTISSSAGEYR